MKIMGIQSPHIKCIALPQESFNLKDPWVSPFHSCNLSVKEQIVFFFQLANKLLFAIYLLKDICPVGFSIPDFADYIPMYFL